jgi:hypothetical protein
MLPSVGGTFVCTPNHDQRPRSLSTAPSLVAEPTKNLKVHFAYGNGGIRYVNVLD